MNLATPYRMGSPYPFPLDLILGGIFFVSVTLYLPLLRCFWMAVND